jgi:hypothetical protein
MITDAESAPLDAAPGFDPEADGPAFQLIDDADGRFVIDSEIGIVTIANDTLLQTEFGAVHGVRMRVRERSGATYELALRLRISGHVPQMAESAALDPIDEPAPPEPERQPKPAPRAHAAPASFSAPQLHFADDGAPVGGDGYLAEDEPFGGLRYAQAWPMAGAIAAGLAPSAARLAPASAGARWTL